MTSCCFCFRLLGSICLGHPGNSFDFLQSSEISGCRGHISFCTVCLLSVSSFAVRGVAAACSTIVSVLVRSTRGWAQAGRIACTAPGHARMGSTSVHIVERQDMDQPTVDRRGSHQFAPQSIWRHILHPFHHLHQLQPRLRNFHPKGCGCWLHQ